jgi:uncharacterized membrane protein YdjX (TVP38/TMEM64 family)
VTDRKDLISLRRAILLVAGVLLLLVAGRAFSTHLVALTSRVHSAGAWGPVLFVACYAIASAAFVLAGLLTLSAGTIFGLAGGATYAFLGATLGACLAFVMARYVARDLVDRRLASAPRAAAVARAVGANGRKIALLLRLSPVIPFSMINVAMGASPIRFADFLLGCAGMLPVTVLYAYYGSVAASLAGTLADPQHGGERGGAAHYTVLLIGLMATMAVTAVVARVAARALRAETRRAA